MYKCLLAPDPQIQTDDVPLLPVDGCSSTALLSVHFPHDALHVSDSVSSPCKKKNAWNGEIVAPVSRSKIARIFVTKAAGPTAFVKLTP